MTCSTHLKKACLHKLAPREDLFVVPWSLGLSLRRWGRDSLYAPRTVKALSSIGKVTFVQESRLPHAFRGLEKYTPLKKDREEAQANFRRNTLASSQVHGAMRLGYLGSCFSDLGRATWNGARYYR